MTVLDDRITTNHELDFGRDAPVPKGYRRLKLGEAIEKGDLYWARGWQTYGQIVPDWAPSSAYVSNLKIDKCSVAFLRPVKEVGMAWFWEDWLLVLWVSLLALLALVTVGYWLVTGDSLMRGW